MRRGVLFCLFLWLFASLAYASIPTDGLIFYLSFDNDCELKDETGHVKKTQFFVQGNPQCVDGIKGKALYFDGDDWIGVDSFFPIFKGTIIVFVKPDRLLNDGENMTILDSKTNFRSFFGFISSPDGPVVRIGYSSAPFYGDYQNRWLMLALVYYNGDESQGKMVAYLNGIKIAENVNNDVSSDFNDFRLNIGSDFFFQTLLKDVSIDEIMFYDRPLSSAEIKLIYHEFTGGWAEDFEDALLGSFPNGWFLSGNKGKIIDTDKGKSFALIGVPGDCWEGIGYHYLGVDRDQFSIDFDVYIPKQGVNGCHYHDAALEFKTGPHWYDETGAYRLKFNVDGHIDVLGILDTWEEKRWYHIHIEYWRTGNKKYFRVYKDGKILGERIADINDNDLSFNYLGLCGGNGQAWFDNIVVTPLYFERIGSNSSNILSEEPKILAYYSFDSCVPDDNGNCYDNVVKDDSGNSNNGIIHGKLDYVPGIKGKAVYFDGNDWIDLPNFFKGYPYISVCAWIKKEKGWGPQSIIDGWKNAETFHISWRDGLTWCGDNKKTFTGFSFGVHPGHPGADYDPEKHLCGTPNPLGRWVFVCGTFDGQTLKLYEDGQLVSQYSYDDKRFLNYSDRYLWNRPSPDIRLGISRYNRNPFKGYLDEIRIYNYPLSLSEIQSLYRGDHTESSVICDSQHLYYCTNAEDCIEVGGFWFNNKCVSKTTTREIKICTSKNKCEKISLNDRFLFFVPPKDFKKIIGITLLFLNDQEQIYPIVYRFFSPYALAIMKAISDVYDHDQKILCESSLFSDVSKWLNNPTMIPIDMYALSKHIFNVGYNTIFVLPIVIRGDKLQTIIFDDSDAYRVIPSSSDEMAAYMLSDLSFIFGAEKCLDGLDPSKIVDCIYTDIPGGGEKYRLGRYRDYLTTGIYNYSLTAISQILPKPYDAVIDSALSSDSVLGILWRSWGDYSAFNALKQTVNKQTILLNVLIDIVRNIDNLEVKARNLHISFLKYLSSFNETSLNTFSSNVLSFVNDIKWFFIDQDIDNLDDYQDEYIYAVLPLYLMYAYPKNSFSFSVSSRIRELITNNYSFWDSIDKWLDYFGGLVQIDFGDDSCDIPYRLFNFEFHLSNVPIIKGLSFPVKITLNDFLGTFTKDTNTVYLSVSSGSIDPSTVRLSNGIWQGQVIVDDVTGEIAIRAESQDVINEVTVQLQCKAPAAPRPVSPAEGEQVRQGDLIFSWQVSTGADAYEIQVASDASFSDVLYEARDIKTAFVNVPAADLGNQLQPGATYYWRVRAVNECGESEWSEPVSFSVPAVEPEITITAPEAGATLTVGETVEITWSYQGEVGDTVKIRYNIGGRRWYTIATGVDVREGSYFWTVPNKPTSRLRIKIESEQNRRINDTAGYFTISE